MERMIDKEFEMLADSLDCSDCDKKKVVAGTYLKSGEFVLTGNFCSHEGKDCPRLHIPSGQGYHLCQSTHAEIHLVSRIKPEELASDTVWIYGHYYACEPCAMALKNIGIKEIRVRESL